MAAKVAAKGVAFRATPRPAASRLAQRLQLVCSAAREHAAAAADRRAVLLGLGAAVAAPLLQVAPAAAKEQLIPVASLTIIQRKQILAELEKRADDELSKVLTAADAPAAMRLLLADAGSYDAATKTGGCDGSIVLPEELNRPENKALAPLVEKLRQAKAAIDASANEGQGPLSWADTIVLAAKVASEAAWRQDKIDKAADAVKGAFIADSFGNPIDVKLGRIDAASANPSGRVPATDASLEEVQAFFTQLGAKPGAGEGAFSRKAPFTERQQFLLWPAVQTDGVATEAAMAAFNPKYAEWKQQYDSSRQTVTRTSYEVDLAATFAKLANLGAKYDKDAYLFPIKAKLPDRY
ncbi:Thylakoid lumenal 29 kDa chloroplastic [Micractinium conductrix]|uniref:Thylakoid lumenal 29 kDa chloroplastic n=1 Tax=Micractinium conductrix TaxID=554055 RepID=A0A2P6VNW9_9CHLO|nr:Thylakoid lumenal 29 kDa chloroplastic [Micractinium conductrix]|eukprot:PSC75757.1 Thylakoid lumenal 29 kDa chloroplastic [Micractinium conductrix]